MVYINMFIDKLSVYINLLLQLNKLSLNIIIIVVIFQTIFITVNYIYMYLVLLYSLVFDVKYINFINLFMFGFFKIHIILFYVMVVVGSFVVFNQNYIQFRLKISNNIFFISIAFFFGSLWSLYLFNWGYYWTNDSIEYILLFFVIYQLIGIHLWKKKIYLVNIYMLLSLFLLFMVRLNVIYTRHNFFQQHTLIYFYIKLCWILILQNFMYIKCVSRFFINRFTALILLFFFLSFLIVVNVINIFFFKILIYNLSTYLFILSIVLNVWGISKYIYIHILAVCIYISFIIIAICYVFSYKFGVYSNLVLFYNYFLGKHIIIYRYMYNLFFINSINNNIAYSKNGVVLFVSNNIFMSEKRLINFII